MTDDSRQSHRVEFERSIPVNMIAIDGTWRQPCMLDDISAEGAKLEIEGACPIEKGHEFFLLLSSSGLVYRRCELSWVNGSQVGVRFVSAKKSHFPRTGSIAA